MKESDLHLSGDLTSSEYPDLRGELSEALASADALLRIHLWAIVDFDAVSVGALVDLGREARATGKEVLYVDAAPALSEAIHNHERLASAASAP